MIGCIPLVAYTMGLHDGGVALGRTMAFATLMFVQLVHVRNLHSNSRSSFVTNPFSNKPLIYAIAASAGMALVVLLVPAIRNAFSLVMLDTRQWIIVTVMSLMPIVVVELFKLFRINGVKSDTV
jgi:Ca2+-transporting ATPase